MTSNTATHGVDCYRAARRAFGRGNTQRAIEKVAAALACNPACREWLAFADTVIAEAGKHPCDDASEFFGEVALRARAAASAGYWTTALSLILEVAAFHNDIPYLLWLTDWLAAIDPHQVEFEVVGSSLAAFTLSLNVPLATATQLNAQQALVLTSHLLRASPDDERLEVLEVTLQARLGNGARALGHAKRYYARGPSWSRAVTLANAHRSQGDSRAALVYYQVARTLDPTHVSAHLDIGDILFQMGDLTGAVDAYDRVLQQSPDATWAQAARSLACYLLQPSCRSMDDLMRWDKDPRIGPQLRRFLLATHADQ